MGTSVRSAGGGRKKNRPPQTNSSITRIAPPVQLRDEFAVSIWKQQSAILIKRGCMEPEDAPVLLSYCNAFSMMLQADRMITEEGITAPTADGIKKHPAVGVRNDCVSQMARMGSLLGLDPLSRTRFTGAGGKKETSDTGNEFDEF
ncbi:phage terminase small subunit P27 family (plasmid) [Marinobacter sp. M3C]|uniref:phage terminase small subunit P27 family n=1 Tax=Marinobacter sp. M3C TaxID=2917715 RepID=UPI00200D9D22|nr:phage terminase small subunit P27 family [Marinobacter sp. M3C]UQG62773.1 phage terminase small subunit P27 family [Marinobacter sp. M3C]